MKKFTKFIGIFLALSLVIGLIPVVGAVDPETPTAPAAPTGAILQGTTYEVVSPTRIETLFGFYEDGTGADEDTFMDCEDGACVTDGWFGRAGYSECTSDDGLIALVMMVDDFIDLGAIEIVAKNAEHRPTDFVIQVMGDSDWETVVTADNDPLASGLTKTFTFDAVETDTVRILINAVDVNSDDGECYLNEVTLFEAVTGNLKTVIDMNGKVSASNANTADCTNNAVDGDKSTFFTGSWMTVDLGEATAIDGFNLYHYRNSSYPDNITVSIQQTEGGEFVQIGTFATSFTSGAPVDSLYVTFDQTYMAYAITFGSDVWGYQNDYELWQYQREAEEEPTVAPTEPAEPTYELTTGAPTTGVAYKWAADTGAAEGILTFVGTSANQTYYLSTSTTMTEGVDVYVEEVTGGYRMYFMDGETKTYIDIYQNGTYVNARLTTEPTAVFTWNDTFGTFVTDISGTAYYLGTYTKASTGVTYTTLSASKLSYMTESNVDVSQFPARFYAEVGTIIPEPTTPPTEEPTPAPTEEPTPAPTEEPTPAPTEEPTPAPTEAPAPEYTWIDLIPESQLTPAVGYYNEGDYTTLTDINTGESVLLTDARVSSGSWVNGNTFPVPNDKVPAAVVEVDGTKIFAGVNICCKPGQELTDFVIEVKNTNGDWVTVNTTAGNTETDVKIIFDTAVLGTAVRMIIIDWNGEHPMVQELWVYEGLNTEPLVQVPVAGVTASQNPVVADQPVDLVIDGKGFTYYQIGAGNMPVDIIFDTTNADGSATNVSRMRIYAFNNSKQAAKDIVVSVKTANEPETWETVYTGVAYELNHTDTFVLDFGATYAAYDVRLTINTVTAENLVLTGVELFGNGEPVAPPVVTPTDPTEEPTQAPTEEPTQEPTKLVGPDGVVNEIVLSNMGTLGSMGITPEFGYYDNAEMTGSVIDYQAAAGEDACLVDGNTNNSGWSGNFNFTDLVDNGGSKVPVILVDLGTATTVGGIELISVLNTCSAPTHFAVQVTTAADSDVWETVLEANNVTWNGKETKQFAFDNAVDAYKLRLVVFNLSELAGSTQTQFALHEVTLMSAQAVPAVDEVPLTGSNVLQFGYYADLELTDYRDSVLSNNVPANLFDGNSSSLAITNTEAWTWGSGAGMAANGGTNTAVLTLDVSQNGAPSAINYMQMIVQGQYRYAPTSYTLQVTTSADEDNWTTVYETIDYSWEDNGTNSSYVTFDEVSAYKVRLLVAKTHVDQNNLCYFGMGEFVLGTVEIVDIPDDPTDPTDPTTPSEPEPTTPSEPEPTVPSEPAEALPEAPVVVPGTTTIAGGVVKEGTVYKLISTKKITTGFGYYNASGAFVDKNDGVCVTDGWYGRSGYSECTSADGQIALIMTLDEVKNIGRVEIVGRTVNGAADNRPVDFEIQALVNGEWITVADVDDDPFATSMTVAYTFPAVATNQIRILINEVVIPTNQCHLNEVELYEVTTGKLYNDIDLTGKISATDAHESAPANQLIDGDKDTYFLGANITFNLTDAEGNPTSVDGFRLFHYRGGSAFPSNVTVLIQSAPGGEFVTLDTFATNWMNTVPQEQAIVEFAETVVAYGMQINLDTYSYVNEFELFQYEKDEAPEEPPVDPTPTDPTVTPTEPGTTEPSVTPTEPSVTPTEPSVTPTEPEATDPSEDPTEPEEPGNDLDFTELEDAFALLETLDPEDFTEDSVAAVENALANIMMMDENVTQEELDEAVQALLDAIDALVPVEDEGTDEPGDDLPDVPVLPGAPDLTEIQATIDRIYDLDPDKYTTESYANLIAVVKDVNKMLATEGGYSQKLIDSANEKLLNALDALVLIDGEGDSNGGDLPAPTGDIALAVLGGLMSLSAIGGAVVIGKKKFF